MHKITRLSIFATLLVAACHRAGAPAAVSSPVERVPPGDWPSYGRTVAGDRFSPLTQIDRSNVARLAQVCEYVLPEVAALQTGPLVVGGTMYFTTDTISYAIDGATCQERWRAPRHSAQRNPLLVHRGFAWLDGRLFRGTTDGHVLAMDPADGQIIWDQTLDVSGPGISYPMAPIAADGLVFIGNAGGDNAGVTGHVFALDARDGRVAWRFDVVPAAGPARATWENPRIPLSGGAFWTSFTYDAAAHVLYVPAGNPAPDFDVALRKGDDLYSNSVIALDGATGRLLAYNQLVKHDSHDWDVDAPPTLVTTRGGRRIIASANKEGLLSILDRSAITRGQPVEANVLPPVIPLRTQTPVATRLNENVPLSRDRLTRFCPGITGGVEWNGAAYSPMTNLLYVGAVDRCVSVRLREDTVPVPTTGRQWMGEQQGGRVIDPADSSRGWMTAVDAETGAIKWKLSAAKPILAGVTPTAGGVVFTADLGGHIYAYDAESGRVLWDRDTGQSIGGGVVAYLAGARELIGIASGMRSPTWPGGAQQSRIVVYGVR
ncbi:MAG TPA: PQQ-binding-like beta-propeller repeat protein [Gemmatimonadaceae bacterium]|jgi:alcohol dehydrogenase (cytochrome c)|nr:PQQ-binding-like beta-propeller repeat protein [Gemmatimonadaceae bacterium]